MDNNSSVCWKKKEILGGSQVMTMLVERKSQRVIINPKVENGKSGMILSFRVIYRSSVL